MRIAGNFLDPDFFKVNTSDGDGSTTIFNLSHTPISSSALFVFINGLRREVTVDWSLSGLQVTFVTAPALGQEIEFNYIRK